MRRLNYLGHSLVLRFGEKCGNAQPESRASEAEQRDPKHAPNANVHLLRGIYRLDRHLTDARP